MRNLGKARGKKRNDGNPAWKRVAKMARAVISGLVDRGKLLNPFHRNDLLRLDARFSDTGEWKGILDYLVDKGILERVEKNQFRFLSKKEDDGLAEAEALAARMGGTMTAVTPPLAAEPSARLSDEEYARRLGTLVETLQGIDQRSFNVEEGKALEADTSFCNRAIAAGDIETVEGGWQLTEKHWPVAPAAPVEAPPPAPISEPSMPPMATSTAAGDDTPKARVHWLAVLLCKLLGCPASFLRKDFTPELAADMGYADAEGRGHLPNFARTVGQMGANKVIVFDAKDGPNRFAEAVMSDARRLSLDEIRGQLGTTPPRPRKRAEPAPASAPIPPASGNYLDTPDQRMVAVYRETGGAEDLELEDLSRELAENAGFDSRADMLKAFAGYADEGEYVERHPPTNGGGLHYTWHPEFVTYMRATYPQPEEAALAEVEQATPPAKETERVEAEAEEQATTDPVSEPPHAPATPPPPAFPTHGNGAAVDFRSRLAALDAAEAEARAEIAARQDRLARIQAEKDAALNSEAGKLVAEITSADPEVQARFALLLPDEVLSRLGLRRAESATDTRPETRS